MLVAIQTLGAQDCPLNTNSSYIYLYKFGIFPRVSMEQPYSSK